MIVLAILYLVTFVLHGFMFLTHHDGDYHTNAFLAIILAVVGISLSISTIVNG